MKDIPTYGFYFSLALVTLVVMTKCLPLNHPIRLVIDRIKYWYRYEVHLTRRAEIPQFDFSISEKRPKQNFLSWLKQRIVFFFGYPPRSYNANPIASLGLLSMLMKLNPWPIQLSINNDGIFLIKRRWHGLVAHENFYPLRQIRSVSTKVILGHFTEICIIVINDEGFNEALKTRQWYFKSHKAGFFFSEYSRLITLQP